MNLILLEFVWNAGKCLSNEEVMSWTGGKEGTSQAGGEDVMRQSKP